MPLYEKEWWKKLFKGKEREKKVDAVNDIQAIKEFLQDVNSDAKILLKELDQLEELEKERQVARSGIIQINLETQEENFEKILERYEFLENDVGINGLRLRMIAKEWLKHAQKAGLKDLVKEKKQSVRWKYLF